LKTTPYLLALPIKVRCRQRARVINVDYALRAIIYGLKPGDKLMGKKRKKIPAMRIHGVDMTGTARSLGRVRRDEQKSKPVQSEDCWV
jgi:hypothetical protein